MSVLAKLAGWKGYALTGAVCLAIGFGGGWKLRDLIADADALKAAKAREKAAVKVIARVAVADKITADVGKVSAERQVEIRTVYRDIIREVPTYVSVESDRLYAVPYGFVRLHDAAAAGTAPAVPGPSQPPNDAPSGVAFSAVASTVADNYGACRADQQRLADLQSWINLQAQAWSKP